MPKLHLLQYVAAVAPIEDDQVPVVQDVHVAIPTAPNVADHVPAAQLIHAVMAVLPVTEL